MLDFDWSGYIIKQLNTALVCCTAALYAKIENTNTNTVIRISAFDVAEYIRNRMLYFLIPADLVRASRKLNTDNPKQSHTQGIWEIIKKRLQGYVLQIIPRSSTCRMDMQIYKIHLVVYKKSRFWDRSRLLLDTQISAGSQLIGWINTDVLYEVRSLTKIIDQPGRYYNQEYIIEVTY